MTYVLLSLLIIVSIALAVAIKRLTQLLRRHEELGKQVNESLDVLDDVYRKISAATEIPVLMDDPIVHNLLADIRTARHAVLLVANKIVTFDDDDEEDDDAA